MFAGQAEECATLCLRQFSSDPEVAVFKEVADLTLEAFDAARHGFLL